MQRTFVVDTNVLLHDPQALFHFPGATVVVPIYVIEELDRFKKEHSQRGRNAREICRQLDQLRQTGALQKGVPLGKDSVLRVELTEEPDRREDPKILTDHLIMGVALRLQKEEPENSVIFVTKDTNLRVRADAMGLESINYEEPSAIENTPYDEAPEVVVTKEQLNECHQQGQVYLRDLDTPVKPYANEYVFLRNGSKTNHTSLTRYSAEEDALQPIIRLRQSLWGIRPRNREQHYALDALLDEKIQFVTLVGKAGTGKTLLALAAGLHCTVDEEMFHKLLVARPIFPLGRDVGYLPGSLEDKLNPWMQPIFDNLDCLIGSRGKKNANSVESLVNQGVIQVEALTFIRGRSIPQQFMIVDEAQNLTPHEIKTILTRAGEGTKIVLTGDPHQIDNPYLDAESNGLSYAVRRFRGEAISAHVTLFKGERSLLAELAANLL